MKIGEKDTKYGGTVTDVAKLPVGTKFYVCNGAWYGEIAVNDAGEKTIKAYSGDHIIHGSRDATLKLMNEAVMGTEEILSITDVQLPQQ